MTDEIHADDGTEEPFDAHGQTLYELSECAIGQAGDAAEDGYYEGAAGFVRLARDDLDALAKRLENRANDQ